ncbi:uncharacterized protein PF3D7_1120000-like [Cardiocondyla obscurior]|uniref:uncharacterized protein PF3D7_1120000-like n=1 Tax=Cardiocondyla obscurior TaxID=286306 RepID=UPI0039655FD8
MRQLTLRSGADKKITFREEEKYEVRTWISEAVLEMKKEIKLEFKGWKKEMEARINRIEEKQRRMEDRLICTEETMRKMMNRENEEESEEDSEKSERSGWSKGSIKSRKSEKSDISRKSVESDWRVKSNMSKEVIERIVKRSISVEREKEKRKNNIIIKGWREEGRIELEKVKGFLKEKLAIKVRIKAVRRNGKVVVVNLWSSQEKREVMIRKSKLKGGSIFIDNDLSWEDRKRQEKLNRWVKEEREKGKDIKRGFGKVQVEER